MPVHAQSAELCILCAKYVYMHFGRVQVPTSIATRGGSRTAPISEFYLMLKPVARYQSNDVVKAPIQTIDGH